MQEIDHVVAGAILLVSVAQAFADPEVLKRAPRTAFFKAAAATGLLMGSLVLWMWHVAGRPIEQFGLVGWIGPDPVPIALAAALWPLMLAAAVWALLTRFRGPAARFYSGYRHLMPHSRTELPLAYGAAGLGGFGEEIAFRGFLIWYLSALAGPSVATLASSLIFGLAHGYQGKVGITFATIAGLLLAGIYLLSASLLLVVWMHATYNIASFTVGYRVLHAPAGGVDRSDAPLRS
ncbi:MAG: CPBP family intramembrane metalloprotease [Sphingomonas sp.]|nr:CPBP family intramembrane metalloprotease [Sphingomonas sp.]